jgi:hypothetical protein
MIVVIVYLSKRQIHVERRKQLYAITVATPKWQLHTSGVLTEGVFIFKTVPRSSVGGVVSMPRRVRLRGHDGHMTLRPTLKNDLVTARRWGSKVLANSIVPALLLYNDGGSVYKYIVNITDMRS